MPLWWNIEYQVSELQIPKEFDDVRNQKDFRDVYKDIVDWYWNNFNKLELSLIKDMWDKSCIEYQWVLDNVKKNIIKNRIDRVLFEKRYPKYLNLDVKIIRTFSNTALQRKYRKVAIDLYNKIKILSDSDLKIINDEFLDAKRKSKVPSYDEILQKILKNNGGRVLENNTWAPNDINMVNNQNSGELEEAYLIEKMLEINVPDCFLDMKKDILWRLGTNNSKKVEWYFNSAVSDLAETYEITELTPEEYDEIYHIMLIYSKAVEKWFHVDLDKNIKTTLFNVIYNSRWKNTVRNAIAFVNSTEINIDFSWIIFDEINEQSRINSLCTDYQCSYEEAVKLIKTKIYCENKIQKWEELNKDEQKIYDMVSTAMKIVDKKIKLQLITQAEVEEQRRHEFWEYKFETMVRSWSMDAISPRSIIQNNPDIHNFVYGKKWFIDNVQNENVDISGDYWRELYNRLVEQRKWDAVFQQNIKYIDQNWEIRMDLVKADSIDLDSVRATQQQVQSMLRNLAQEDFANTWKREKINEISSRKAVMTCCFSAISQYFDRTNANGENFAKSFQLDVWSDISFDGSVIYMRWKMWDNTVWLYYNVDTWDLSFDNFLDFDNETKSYVIWNQNWRRELMNIKLPIMTEMMNISNSIDFGQIISQTDNMHDYRLAIEAKMNEKVWTTCFLWGKMYANKDKVELFNEKNLLKQDILKNIYTNFYNEQDVNALFNWKFEVSPQKTEQYKLIALIYHSIDKCESADDLLKFRNMITQLDTLLLQDNVVENDEILRYLFADNVLDENDVYSLNKKTMQDENGESLWQAQSPVEVVENQPAQEMLNENQWNMPINYFTFLDLCAWWEWENRAINLQAFEDVLRMMSTEWKVVNDCDNSIFLDNKMDKQLSGELPWLSV